MFLREDAITIVSFLAYYVADKRRTRDGSEERDSLFPLAKKVLNATVDLPGQMLDGPPVRLLKPLCMLVASTVAESSGKVSFNTNDVMVSGVIVNISTAQSILHSEGKKKFTFIIYLAC